MDQEFIHPNWHIILIHYPLGLLTVGVLIELLSFMWRRSSVRQAGRWMILLGALGCIPTMTMGLYAFRDVVSPQPIDSGQKWYQVVKNSIWGDAQWHHMDRHIWFTSSGSALVILAALVWLACSNVWRQKLYLPVMVMLLGSLGLLSAGAWHSGEAIYRHGTAVSLGAHESMSAAPAVALTPTTQPAMVITQASPSTPLHLGNSTSRTERPQIEHYIQPLQLHILLAGLTVAIALGALGLTIRRWTLEPRAIRYEEGVTLQRMVPTQDPARGEYAGQPPLGTGVTVAPPLFPARVWLAAALVAIGTAEAGIWFTADWRVTALTIPFQDAIARKDMQRLFGHVLFGASIVLLTLLLALLTRVARRSVVITSIISFLLVLAVAGQVWLGILMLFDSNMGPLTQFTRP